MNMKEPQVTKNTLKDLYAVMDNKKAMQVLLEAKDAKDVIEYLKSIVSFHCKDYCKDEMEE